MRSHSRGARRRLATVAVPMAAALLLAACGGDSGSEGNGEEPQTITFAIGSANPGEHHFQDIAAAYEKAHPGVKITIQKLPGESYATAIATRVQGGNAPDVFQSAAGAGQPHAVGNLGKANLLLKLTDPSFKEALPPGEDPTLFMYDGVVVGVPTSTAVNGIIFNDELGKQNGVTITASSTLDEVIDQCAAARAKGKSVFGLAGAAPVNPGIATMELAASTVYGSTPDWDAQRKEDKVTFADTPGWTTALESMKRLYEADCFQPGAVGAGFDALTNGLGQGRIMGFFAPSGAAKNIMDAAGGKVKLVILPFPAPAGTKTYASVSSDILVSGSAKTKSPKLVTDFIKYFQSAEGAKVLADGQGTLPAVASDDTALLPQYAPVEQLIKSEDVRGFGTNNWPNPKVYDALGTGVVGVMTGRMQPEDVLERMDAAWG